MAKHNKVGKKGESLAKSYLEELGYNILEENWRFSRAEIDIIAKIDEILVFVEVKTRSDDYFGEPEDQITPKKIKLMTDAASAYMEKTGHEWEIRFDVIGVLILDANHHEIRHFEDAFFPSW